MVRSSELTSVTISTMKTYFNAICSASLGFNCDLILNLKIPLKLDFRIKFYSSLEEKWGEIYFKYFELL